MKTLLDPGSQMCLGVPQIDSTDADLLKSELAAPTSDVSDKRYDLI